MTAQPTPATPQERRHQDLLRSERTMVWVRALAVLFGLVQVYVYDVMAYPPGHLEAALGLVAALGAVDAAVLVLLLAGWPRTLRRARGLALATVALDSLVAVLFVVVYSFDPISAHWAVLFVVPLLGAARFRLVGAIVTWAGITVLYTLRELYAAATFAAVEFSGPSVSFRMGLVLLVALVAGLLARDLAQEQERTAAALEEVARVDRLRARLVGSLAHDMRSPLMAISGSLSTLGPTRPPAVQEALLDIARRQTARLTRLTTGMLDLARLEGGQLELNRRPTRVDEVVDAVIDALGPDEGQVVVDVPRDLHVDADPDRLDQILFNLVGNALRHGAPPVEVRAEAEGGSVVLVVADHGRGVPEQHRAALFDAFATNAVGGVGLGLWLVRALADAHGGEVRYRAHEDGGACFEVELPSASAPADLVQG